MKLNNKILIGNLVLSAIVMLVTGIGMYYLIFDTVYEELDNHLLQHKTDILNQVQSSPESLRHIRDLGGLGSYEWVDITPVDSSKASFSDSYATIDTLRYDEQGSPEQYRRLATVMTVDGTTYSLNIYEEVAAWENISRTILLSVLAGLLIWIILLYLLNQIAFERILKPFYNTVDALETISTPADFSHKFPESTTYEISVLNRALNRMMDHIASSFEEQKRFIQNASHELLTPLSIIRQKAEKILSHSDELDADTVQSASDIHHTAVRLTRLSNTLLLISRVENRQYELHDTIEISEVVSDILDELRDFTTLKKIDVTIEKASDITLTGNRELIQSAVYNVIQNAVKFTPEDSSIQIVIGGGPRGNELKVQDEGPGIQVELKGSLFDRFKKSNGHTNRLGKNDGSGLGLSIVKSICSLHNIDCEACNREGRGTELTLRF
mgnify:CR=1 FL=1